MLYGGNQMKRLAWHYQFINTYRHTDKHDWMCIELLNKILERLYCVYKVNPQQYIAKW